MVAAVAALSRWLREVVGGGRPLVVSGGGSGGPLALVVRGGCWWVVGGGWWWWREGRPVTSVSRLREGGGGGAGAGAGGVGNMSPPSHVCAREVVVERVEMPVVLHGRWGGC